MSEVNHRRNGHKYCKTQHGHGWTRASRKASRFWKRYGGPKFIRMTFEIEVV